MFGDVPDIILPGDVTPGDVIALADGEDDLLVTAVRLGRGGFLLTVVPPAGPPERVVVLTAGTPVLKRGADYAVAQPLG